MHVTHSRLLPVRLSQWGRIGSLLILLPLIHACTSMLPRAPLACDYEATSGEELVLRPLYGPSPLYQGWRQPGPPPSSLAYAPYQGTRLKLLAVDSKSPAFPRPALTEHCEPIQALNDRALAFESYPLDRVQEAQALAGSRVWLSPDYRLPLGVGPEGQLTTTRHLEALQVEDVELTSYRHSAAGDQVQEPIYLKVLRESGEQGLLPWYSSAILPSNPVKADWPAGVQRAIAAQRVQLGMTAEQVRLAWGSPHKRVSRSSGGAHYERWLYPRGAIYFRSGKVLSFQR